MAAFSVTFETTPNPQSLKFNVGRPIVTEPAQFSKVEETAQSPLARKIFGFPWAAGVYIGADFVTVTKQDWVDWDILAEPLAGLIQEHLERGEPVFVAVDSAASAADQDGTEDSPVVRQIKQILREEIRPAVAMDGGDILFHKYENGRVFLEMHGACSGCPSSMYTLKEGVETRLKERIPEILEVIAI